MESSLSSSVGSEEGVQRGNEVSCGTTTVAMVVRMNLRSYDGFRKILFSKEIIPRDYSK